MHVRGCRWVWVLCWVLVCVLVGARRAEGHPTKKGMTFSFQEKANIDAKLEDLKEMFDAYLQEVGGYTDRKVSSQSSSWNATRRPPPDWTHL